MDAVPRLNPATVICLAILIVVAINGGLILAARRGETHRQADMLRRAFNAARNPWAKQDKELTELRERVSKLENNQESPDE